MVEVLIPEKITFTGKRSNKSKRELFEILDTYGAKSKEFYNYIKPFIVSNIVRFLNPELESDDALIQDCYMAVLRGFCGGYTCKYGKWIWLDAYFDRNKCKDPINFVITLIRGPISLRNYHGLKHHHELGKSEEFFGNIKAKDEQLEVLRYDFQHFEFGSSMKKHINEIFKLGPQNNLFYNLVYWNDFSSREDEYRSV